MYVSNAEEASHLNRLTKQFVTRVEGQESKLVRNMQMSEYCAYYFLQDPFTFLLIARNYERQARMQNYLRIVADIYYENEDERKFKYVLARIIVSQSLYSRQKSIRQSPGILSSRMRKIL